MTGIDPLFCALCTAGQCGHPECKSAGWGRTARTLVAGTASCNECTPKLLELVMHPLRAVPAPPELRE